MGIERQKMLAGELYNPLDPELTAARERARDLCRALNDTRESQHTERRRILQDLFGTGGDSVWMQPPFYWDYASNIHLGTRVFFDFNCVVLDVCKVRIGDYTLFGPERRSSRHCIPSMRPCLENRSSASQWRLAQTFGLVAEHSY
jgi:maltose O-acetyltransferase